MSYPETSGTRRAATFGGVVLFHVAVLLVLGSTGNLPAAMIVALPAKLLVAQQAPPPPPPRVLPKLEAVPMLSVPAPDIKLVAPAPKQPRAPQAVTRAAPNAPPASHFGASTSGGLGLDVAASSGGGAGSRGTLAGFEAAVRAKVRAGKRQPTLAWDRRNTCVVNYTVNVTMTGTLAGFSIDPCAIPEINEAARAAIRDGAPYPAPPNLGATTAEVHGTLIFHP